MGIEDTHQKWMRHALALAKQAEEAGEVPVGAILLLGDKVIGEGHNQPISSCDPTAHAEIVALRKGAQAIGNYRLLSTTLYVTLEPCMMCVGAMIHARISHLVFGADDLKTGAVTSAANLLELPRLNHKIIYQAGVLGEECGQLLQRFFQSKRFT